jgi:hypothetical protein
VNLLATSLWFEAQGGIPVRATGDTMRSVDVETQAVPSGPDVLKSGDLAQTRRLSPPAEENLHRCTPGNPHRTAAVIGP